MLRVLFVCLGNICRSPMAEGIFQHLVDQAGLSGQIEIDSTEYVYDLIEVGCRGLLDHIRTEHGL